MKAILKDMTEVKISVVQKAITEEETGVIKTNIFMKSEESDLNTIYTRFSQSNIEEIQFLRDDGTGYTDHFTRVEQVSQRFSDTENIISVTLQ